METKERSAGDAMGGKPSEKPFERLGHERLGQVKKCAKIKENEKWVGEAGSREDKQI